MQMCRESHSCTDAHVTSLPRLARYPTVNVGKLFETFQQKRIWLIKLRVVERHEWPALLYWTQSAEFG